LAGLAFSALGGIGAFVTAGITSIARSRIFVKEFAIDFTEFALSVN
jgi:hypothetical protein